jgi:hypothetical protein
MKTTTLAAFALATLALTACASRDQARVTEAATTPLSDLNLVSAPIPGVLVEAQKHPYAVPADTACPALAANVRALDEVLGPDLDTPPLPNNPGLIERGTTFLGDTAVGELRGAAERVVPFRQWVRKLSGAERYTKDVAAAIAAGTARRAFLKGVRVTRGCA